MISKDLPELCYSGGCRRLKDHSGSHDIYPTEAWGFFEDRDQNKLNKAGFATPRGGKKGAYQNHVDRSNKVIIPYEFLGDVALEDYQAGYVIRLFPHQFFESAGKPWPEFLRADSVVKVGTNAFVLYRTHHSYRDLPPLPGWTIRRLLKNGVEVKTRRAGVEDVGEYVLRLPTLGKENKEVCEGPPQGIFATEYANATTNFLCKCVLAWLTIQTSGSPYSLAQAGHLRSILAHEELDKVTEYERAGAIGRQLTQCPLCLRLIKYHELHDTVAFEDESGLENAGLQVEGATRSTIVNLFHLRPLFYHKLVHVPQNVAWGHAACNTRLGQRPCYSLAEIIEMDRKLGFVKEEGIETFGWMSDDDIMIRSAEGAVWIQISVEGHVDEGPPPSTEVVVDAATQIAKEEGGDVKP